jgi:hypothetical protein
VGQPSQIIVGLKLRHPHWEFVQQLRLVGFIGVPKNINERFFFFLFFFVPSPLLFVCCVFPPFPLYQHVSKPCTVSTTTAVYQSPKGHCCIVQSAPSQRRPSSTEDNTFL